MANISELVASVYNRVYALAGYNIHDNLEKRYEFKRQAILTDKFLTEGEKLVLMGLLNFKFDNDKILFNEGTKRICKNCQGECLATSYCELCIRNCLKKNFLNWTSENDDIDNLIQSCQMIALAPYKIIEWIPYNNLQNIKYLTKGGCSEIYTADWIDGPYTRWSNKRKKLRRFGNYRVILKRLENVKSADKNWLDEGKSHLFISNKWASIVRCYGLTKDPSDGNYMLVMNKMDMDLRKYLQQNHHKLTWKERISITSNIVEALYRIHNEKAIHRDLHSGNILLSSEVSTFYISDLGFCGPANKPLNKIYGNLPYIAPEIIVGKETTYASDIYSIAMLMWEISSGQPPFVNFKHDYYLARDIINGMRPKIISGTPLKYKILMEQCWNANPTERPNISHLRKEIGEIKKLYYQNENIECKINDKMFNNIYTTNYHTSSSSVNSLVNKFSRVHIFENLPEPRNATEEEQEAYHDSKQHKLNIPMKIDDIVSEQYKHQIEKSDIIIDNEINSKSKRIYFNEDGNENLINNIKFKKIKLNNNNKDMEEDDIFNIPNLHSEDQEELEIPEDGF